MGIKDKTYKIIFYGKAGSGMQLLARLFVNQILKTYKDINISYYFDYDSTVRGGDTLAYITTNIKNKIKEFVFRKCDLLISFEEEFPKKIKPVFVIGNIDTKNAHKIDFRRISLEKFKTQLYANMIVLGYLCAKFKINITIKLDKINKSAFKLGYSLYK